MRERQACRGSSIHADRHVRPSRSWSEVLHPALCGPSLAWDQCAARHPRHRRAQHREHGCSRNYMRAWMRVFRSFGTFFFFIFRPFTATGILSGPFSRPLHESRRVLLIGLPYSDVDPSTWAPVEGRSRSSKREPTESPGQPSDGRPGRGTCDRSRVRSAHITESRGSDGPPSRTQHCEWVSPPKPPDGPAAEPEAEPAEPEANASGPTRSSPGGPGRRPRARPVHGPTAGRPPGQPSTAAPQVRRRVLTPSTRPVASRPRPAGGSARGRGRGHSSHTPAASDASEVERSNLPKRTSPSSRCNS